ncbi:MAG TPA: hypothetical protein VM733_14525 [Thermoanaerobaculia bacterium]|nr:hypothetical protein [Thermoanaerobaculia bacterium]
MFRNDSNRRLRASVLALAMLAVIAAAVLPACADSLCCAKLPVKQTMHAQMPCCEPTLAPRTASVQPVTPAASAPQTSVPVAAIEPPPQAPPRVQALRATVEGAHHETPPTLFLLNAQFLI